MNVIQRQADDFIKYKLTTRGAADYKKFIQDARSQIWNYRKNQHKMEFTERLIYKTKEAYEAHFPKCTAKIRSECPENIYYEHILFLLQEELEELELQVTPDDFSSLEKKKINEVLQLIVDDLNRIKQGQEVTYDDFQAEFEELKDFYFLNKKNWSQLFAGKLTEMVAGGMISETISKDLIAVISKHYLGLLGQ